MVPKANSDPQTPLTNVGPVSQHRLSQISSEQSNQDVFLPRCSPSTITPSSDVASAADPLPLATTTTTTTTVADGLPSQAITPPWAHTSFRVYDMYMPLALAAGNTVKQHDLPWPVLALPARHRPRGAGPHPPQPIYNSDVTPDAVAGFVRAYCAWKGWSVDVGRARMLED